MNIGSPTILQRELLLQVLRAPERMRSLALAQWDTLLRQARHADLVSRLAVWADLGGFLDQLPHGPQANLRAGLTLARAQREAVQREVHMLREELRPARIPIVLLKGAAYVMADRAAAVGRTFSDIDILVPRAALGPVEQRLMVNGWYCPNQDPYDQRYYRQWMHELPPMVHLRRTTTLDVHHAILPDTAWAQPDSKLLLQDSEAVEGDEYLRVLSLPDAVLHSATHLLHNEEMTHGLRDLSDLDLLLRAGAQGPHFWNSLLQRAVQLGLQRPLFYALEQVQGLLGTPVPKDALAQARRLGAPSPAVAALMRWVWTRGLGSLHPLGRRPGTALALGLIFVRAHALRMPPGLLTYHLAVKAWRSISRRDAPAST